MNDEKYIDELVRLLSAHTHKREEVGGSYQVMSGDGHSFNDTTNWIPDFKNSVEHEMGTQNKAFALLVKKGPNILPHLYPNMLYRHNCCQGEASCRDYGRNAGQRHMVKLITSLESQIADNDFSSLKEMFAIPSVHSEELMKKAAVATCLALLGDQEGHDYMVSYAFDNKGRPPLGDRRSLLFVLIAGETMTAIDLDGVMQKVLCCDYKDTAMKMGVALYVEGYTRAHPYPALRFLFEENQNAAKTLDLIRRKVQWFGRVYSKSQRFNARKIYALIQGNLPKKSEMPLL